MRCPCLRPLGSCKQVLGLTQGYHGDTLGAMDAVAPSPYNGRLQTPWFQGRGLFLEPPTAGLVGGRWTVAPPPSLAPPGGLPAEQLQFGGLEELLDAPARDASGGALADAYRAHIEAALEEHAVRRRQGGAALGACILEPVLQGAGGMRLVDPLFQRLIVQACRRAGQARPGRGGGAGMERLCRGKGAAGAIAAAAAVPQGHSRCYCVAGPCCRRRLTPPDPAHPPAAGAAPSLSSTTRCSRGCGGWGAPARPRCWASRPTWPATPS